jgi:porin
MKFAGMVVIGVLASALVASGQEPDSPPPQARGNTATPAAAPTGGFPRRWSRLKPGTQPAVRTWRKTDEPSKAQPAREQAAPNRTPEVRAVQYEETLGVPAGAAAGPGIPSATMPGGGPPPQPDAASPPGAAGGQPPRGSMPVSSNPGAVNIQAGTGALGRFLGIPDESGVRFGGLWIGDASGTLVGGIEPGHWGETSLTIADIYLDFEKMWGWKGGSFGTEFLQFSGQAVNEMAGTFPGFNSLEGSPPLVRQQLYQLWYRQEFGDKLIVRIGKSIPTYDFGNVVRPVPVSDPSAAIPAVSSLLYTPIFVNPTMLGIIPGYYNSATGITTTLTPTERLYLNYGFYDGNRANHVQTGLTGPRFNGYYFHIGEVGYAYRLGEERKPGNFGIGGWGQTGKLDSFEGGKTTGAAGLYLFGAQRLWYRHPDVDNSGVSGFYQYGVNNSNALLARDYVGAGLTGFGLVPGRPNDSMGCGIAWTALTRGYNASTVFFPHRPPGQISPSELMLQWYYQMKLANGWFFQTTLTEIPTPGIRATVPSAFTISLQLIVLF